MPDRLGDNIRLQHILDVIAEIQDYIVDVEREEFVSNSMMFNATLRQLEIIGEASNNLSEEFLQHKRRGWLSKSNPGFKSK